ncbi:hypothetical protein [Solimonas soli]|uniref:hypothetical protein n=1 Tax=Solimonas soli TaxID=413479 RepID=UPI00048988A1|nr:hypothetical protein [Solimonas soli]
MSEFDNEVEAAQHLLAQRQERAGDFTFRKKERPVMQCADGRCLSLYDVEVTTKRRGVKLAHYTGGDGHAWVEQFGADLAARRFTPEGD